MRGLVEGAKIVLLCILAAVGYGIVHDQITARICIEYFTVAHPHIIASNSPTMQGLAWGVVATWWVGVLLGFPLAFAARLGRGEKWGARQLVRPLLRLLAVCGAAAVAAGILGGVMGALGLTTVFGPFAERIPEERHVRFQICLEAHNASYLFGFVGGVVLAVKVKAARRAGTSSCPP